MEENGDVKIKDEPLSYEEKLQFVTPIAKPIATKHLLKKICKVTKKANKRKCMLHSIKPVEKALRKGEKGIVFLAGDIYPLEIMCHIPVMCEDRGIPYCYVPSKFDLSESIGKVGPVLVLLVKNHTDYKESFEELEKQMKYLPSPL